MRDFIRFLAIAITLLATPAAAVAQTATLAGTWKGLLTGGDGTSAEVQVDLSPQGLPVYFYTNNRGMTRQVELSRVGQTVEYVPPGGGVQRVVVRAIERTEGRLTVVIAGSFEKANQGYLDQRFEEALFEYVPTPNGLNMKVTSREASHFGDNNTIVSGQPNAAVAEGLLQLVR